MPCEPNTPSAAAVALDQHIGNEVGGLLRLEGGGGLGLEASNEGQGLRDGLLALAAGLGQAGHRQTAEVGQVALNQALGEAAAGLLIRCLFVVGQEVLDLQQQAFLQGACAHANRVEGLQQSQAHSLLILLEGPAQVGFEDPSEPVGQVCGVVPQVAVLVEPFDENFEPGAVALAQVKACGLLSKVVGQARGLGIAGLVVRVLAPTTAPPVGQAVSLHRRPVIGAIRPGLGPVTRLGCGHFLLLHRGLATALAIGAEIVDLE